MKGVSGVFKGGKAVLQGTTALSAQEAPAAVSEANPVAHAVGQLSGRLEIEAAAQIEGMIDQIEAMMEAAGSLAEFREMLMQAFPSIDSGSLAQIMAQAMLSAWGAGRAAIEEEAGA